MKIDAALPKETRILLAAEQVFSRLGYEKATLDEIIALADVGKGTLYKYFGSKEQLFYKLVADKNKPFVERLQRAMDSGATVEQKMHGFFREMIEFYEKNNALWQVICFEMLSAANGYSLLEDENGPVIMPRISELPVDEKIKERTMRYYRLIYDEYIIFQRLMVKCVADGTFKYCEDARIMSKFIFFGVAMSIFNPNYSKINSYPYDELAHMVVDRMLYGHATSAAAVRT